MIKYREIDEITNKYTEGEVSWILREKQRKKWGLLIFPYQWKERHFERTLITTSKIPAMFQYRLRETLKFSTNTSIALISSSNLILVFIKLSFDFCCSHYLYPLVLFANYCFRTKFFLMAFLHWISDYFIPLFLQFFSILFNYRYVFAVAIFLFQCKYVILRYSMC